MKMELFPKKINEGPICRGTTVQNIRNVGWRLDLCLLNVLVIVEFDIREIRPFLPKKNPLG